ncbi:MAG: EFR1 family ferrodoxin [Peptostreptococcaceae bacterium]|nr:EFR1 family ferrodoxin [Peptostreptococcaceae bacterium]
MKINIFYFTGTGNSLLIANEIERVFVNRGHECQLINIEKVTSPDCSKCNMIGLVFPVAIQSTFPNVWKFIKALPESKGTKVFMADTLMSFSGGVVGPAKKILDKKGYECIGSIEIKMGNSMMTVDKDIDYKSISDKAVKEAGSYANDILDGKTEWAKTSISQVLMKSFSNGRLFGRLIVKR